jgi:hypothetical protein
MQCKMDGRFHGGRPVGRPRLRWDDNIRNIRGIKEEGRDWQGIEISGSEILKWPRPNVGCRAMEEEKEEEEEDEEEEEEGGGGEEETKRSKAPKK